jgi:glycerol uptake facilitator-like aquaporin
VGNLPSTLLEDFVITAMLHLVVMLVVASSKIASSRLRHLVLGMFYFGGGAYVDTDTGSSPKSLFFYYIWIISFEKMFLDLKNVY